MSARALVIPADHATALALVTTWQERHDAPDSRTTTGAQLELVGMIAAAIADGRATAGLPDEDPA